MLRQRPHLNQPKWFARIRYKSLTTVSTTLSTTTTTSTAPLSDKIKSRVISSFDGTRFTTKAKLPANFWHKRSNQREFLDYVRSRYFPGPLESMYKITNKHILDAGGSGLLKQYSSSAPLAVMAVYPEHRWQPWKFNRLPLSWWRKLTADFFKGDKQAVEMVQRYVEDIGSTIGVHSPADWTQEKIRLLSSSEIRRLSCLGSIDHVLKTLYPSDRQTSNMNIRTLHRFSPPEDQLDFWKCKSNQKLYLDFLKDYMGGRMEDLYGATTNHVLETGVGILKQYNGSIALAIRSVYSEHPWKLWKFRCTPKGWWENIANRFKQVHDKEAEEIVRAFIQDLQEKLNISHPDEWKCIPTKMLGHDAKLLRRLGGIKYILERLYPNEVDVTNAALQNALQARVNEIIPSK